MASREFERRVRKLKDGDGNYLWKTGLDGSGGGQFGASLLGHPLLISEYSPGSDWNSGDYICLFGNLEHYWIADDQNIMIQRLDELFARTHQVGFIIRYSGDGMPVLAPAFKRLKLK